MEGKSGKPPEQLSPTNTGDAIVTCPEDGERSGLPSTSVGSTVLCFLPGR